MVGNIVCDNGFFKVSGECLLVDATRQVRTIRATVGFETVSAEDGPVLDLAWAFANRDLILEAVSKAIGVEKPRIMLDFFPKGEGGTHTVDRDFNIAVVGGKRRRLSDVAEFDMRLTVIVSGHSDQEVGQLASQYFDRLVGHAESSPGGDSSPPTLAAALASELGGRGEAAPTGITITPILPPAIDSLVVPVQKWITGDWEVCDSDCGAGISNRTIGCPYGDDSLCDPRKIPPSEIICERYDGCSFEVQCPLGPGTMNCVAQASTLVISCALLVAGCCIFVVRRCMSMGRPVSSGMITLRSAKTRTAMKPSFTIYRPGPPANSDPSSSQVVQSVVEVRESTDPSGDGKTHVVWELTGPTMQKYFAEQGMRVTLDEATGLGLDNSGAKAALSQACMSESGLPRLSMASRVPSNDALGVDVEAGAISDATADQDPFLDDSLEQVIVQVDEMVENGVDAASRLRATRDLETDVLSLTEPLPRSISQASRCSSVLGGSGRSRNREKFAYTSGNPLEYYSETLNRWVASTARVSYIRNPDRRTISTRFDIILASGQRRYDVGMESLRSPLVEGEMVEVFSKGAGGIWLPCRLSSGLRHRVSYVYNVDVLIAECPSLPGVPPERLRRRYTVGEAVSVYRGRVRGWVRGQVSSQLQDPPPEESNVLFDGPIGHVTDALATPQRSGEKKPTLTTDDFTDMCYAVSPTAGLGLQAAFATSSTGTATAERSSWWVVAMHSGSAESKYIDLEEAEMLNVPSHFMRRHCNSGTLVSVGSGLAQRKC